MRTFEEILFEHYNYLDENEVIEDFENHINNEYSFFNVGGPFSMMEPIEVLQAMEPEEYEEMKREYIAENFIQFSTNQYFRTDEYENALEMFEEEKIDNSVFDD